MIRGFMDNRLVATSEMLLANNTWFRATAEFLIRRRASGLLSDDQAWQRWPMFRSKAALEAFLATFVGMPARCTAWASPGLITTTGFAVGFWPFAATLPCGSFQAPPLKSLIRRGC